MAHKLLIRVNGAKNLPDVGTFSKPDPFCRISFEGSSYNTSIVDNSLHPRWPAGTFMLHIHDLNDPKSFIDFELFNANVFVDDFLGRASLPLNMLVDDLMRNKEGGSFQGVLKLQGSYAWDAVVDVSVRVLKERNSHDYYGTRDFAEVSQNKDEELTENMFFPDVDGEFTAPHAKATIEDTIANGNQQNHQGDQNEPPGRKHLTATSSVYDRDGKVGVITHYSAVPRKTLAGDDDPIKTAMRTMFEHKNGVNSHRHLQTLLKMQEDQPNALALTAPAPVRWHADTRTGFSPEIKTSDFQYRLYELGYNVNPDFATTFSGAPTMGGVHRSLGGIAPRQEVSTSSAIGTGQPLPVPPAVASWGPKRLDLFVVGRDHCVWTRFSEDSGQSWSRSAQSLGDQNASGGVGVCSLGHERLLLCVVDDKKQLHVRDFAFPEWERKWVTPHPDVLVTAPPVVMSPYEGRVDIFFRGENFGLYQMTRHPGREHFGNPRYIGGQFRGSPAVVVNPDAYSNKNTRFDVFVRGGDDQLLHIASYPYGRWQRWSRIGVSKAEEEQDAAAASMNRSYPGVNSFLPEEDKTSASASGLRSVRSFHSSRRSRVAIRNFAITSSPVAVYAHGEEEEVIMPDHGEGRPGMIESMIRIIVRGRDDKLYDRVYDLKTGTWLEGSGWEDLPAMSHVRSSPVVVEELPQQEGGYGMLHFFCSKGHIIDEGGACIHNVFRPEQEEWAASMPLDINPPK